MTSASAIAAQGLLRLGCYLGEQGKSYTQAGLSVSKTLFAAPYLSEDPEHEGLLLHSVYHRPKGWDWEPGVASMWGDYHARELALMLKREAEGRPWLTFFTVRKSV